MTETRCGSCGTMVLPDNNFCRQCGSPVPISSAQFSERPTAIFEAGIDPTTQRLDARHTSPDPTQVPMFSPPGTATGPIRRRSKNWLLIVLVVVLVAGVFGAAAVMKKRNAGRPAVTQTFGESSERKAAVMYPGAQVTLDLSNADGTRAVQLQTSDSLEKVESWYQSNLELNKTVRLSSVAVVLKGEKITITLASAGGNTSILIKQAP